jgi:hypothetical protein
VPAVRTLLVRKYVEISCGMRLRSHMNGIRSNERVWRH